MSGWPGSFLVIGGIKMGEIDVTKIISSAWVFDYKIGWAISIVLHARSPHFI